MAGKVNKLRRKVAQSCRILAEAGLVREITGHVSARIPGANEMVIRCRGDYEWGLAFTGDRQVRQLDFDGQGDGLGTHHVTPLELPIHGEIYKARPDVGAVVHAHPTGVLLCGLAGLELTPIFGAYDAYALEIAERGIPVFPSSVLIDTTEAAGKLVETLGEADACIMRGHGVTVVGESVEQATLRALKVEALAQITWALAASGKPIPALPQDERAAFAARSRGGVIPHGERWIWRHYVRKLDESDGGQVLR
jgi:ribulose-5-phosphate 4-epimerase/fuculose-1-phosphate aldolase